MEQPAASTTLLDNKHAEKMDSSAASDPELAPVEAEEPSAGTSEPIAEASPAVIPAPAAESGLDTEFFHSTEPQEGESAGSVVTSDAPDDGPAQVVEEEAMPSPKEDIEAAESVANLSLESDSKTSEEVSDISTQETTEQEPKPSPTAVESSEVPSLDLPDLATPPSMPLSVALPSPLSLPLTTRHTAWDKENYDHTRDRFLNDKVKTAPPALSGSKQRKGASGGKRVERIQVLADVTEAYYAKAAVNAISMMSPLEDPTEPTPEPVQQRPRRAPAGMLSSNSAAANGVRRVTTDPASKTAIRTSPKRTASDASIVSATAPPPGEGKRRATTTSVKEGSGSSSAANLRKMR